MHVTRDPDADARGSSTPFRASIAARTVRRALQVEDKDERRAAILDAAQRLFTRLPGRLPTVAELADATGLAKGTFYLYFRSKEDLLLSLYERSSERFFGALIERLDHPEPITTSEIFGMMRDHVLHSPACLPVATMCLGMTQKGVSSDAASAFRVRMAERLTRAGEGVERRFPAVKPGRGTVLLVQSYSLVVGLWQLCGNKPVLNLPHPSGNLCRVDYETEVERALRALWAGATQRAGDADHDAACGGADSD
jgi:AcrR family transcriptional regulator